MTVLSVGAVILTAFVGLIALGLAAGVLVLLWKLFRAVFWLVGRALRFVHSEVVATIHTVGALVTACATVPLAVVNLVILRMGAARHYARAFGDELKSVGAGLWRVSLGNPLRLVGLGGLVDRVEQHLPDIVERAPRGRRARQATFDGYDVIGTLPSGGSGAQLFVARPRSSTLKRFLRAGRALPGEVVIKSFALQAGSTLPQIVRESRALEAASRLGLVSEHHLSNDHFYYVMPYVKGEDLDRVIRVLHGRSGAEGLGSDELRLVLGYAIDLLDSLQRFHSGGLWHKDVKPANVIVASGRAHLVDFGLVTPLASALTLTTHGTEYYRDPEMVRLAMQGVKVHEVDGARFDVYSAGAVLFAMLENGFPAHGSLSRITKRCPDALRWVVQRAMAEMRTRYVSAGEMRADLSVLAAASDPYGVRPADLPSFQSAAEPAAAGASFVSPSARASEPWRPVPPASEPARVPPRRRFLPGLALAAAGVFGLFTLAGATAFFGHRRAQAFETTFRDSRWVREDDRPEPRSWNRLSEREGDLVELARGIGEDLGTPVEDASSSELYGSALEPSREPPGRELDRARPAAETETTGASDVRPHGRVLVLDDLTSGVDARVLVLLRERLVERGFEVVGEESDGAKAAEAVELLALARNAVGLGRPDEPDVEQRLQGFLDGSADLTALILVSGPAGPGEHLYRVFVRSPAPAGAR